MSVQMSDEEVIKFIDYFRCFPCIYEIGANEYRNRIMAKGAYLIIARSMGNGMSGEDVKKKIRSLRTQYIAHLNTLLMSRKRGAGVHDVKHQNWKFFSHLDFLRRHVTAKKRLSNDLDQPAIEKESVTIELDVDDSQLDGSQDQWHEVCLINDKNKPKDITTTPTPSYSSIAQPHLMSGQPSEDTSLINTQTPRFSSFSTLYASSPLSHPNTFQDGKRKKTEDSTSKLINMLTKYINSKREAIDEQKKIQSGEPSEENRSFGNYIACALTKMSYEDQVKAKFEISKVVYEILHK